MNRAPFITDSTPEVGEGRGRPGRILARHVRILIVSSQYHRGGGFPRYATQLAIGLDRRGHHVTVLTGTAEPGPDDSAIEFLNYRCPRRSLLLTMLFETPIVSRRLRAVANSYDAVLSIGLPVLHPAVLFGTGAHRGYFEATLSSLRPSSWRWWFEWLRPFHRIVMFWEGRMLRRGHARRVVVGAEPFRQEYLDLFGVDPDRVVVVPLAVEHQEFAFDPALRAATRKQLGVDDDVAVLVNVAGRGRQKGLDVLAHALTRLPENRRWLALLAGDGSNSRMVSRLTADLERVGRVRRLGRVDDVRALFCAADLLVFPSRYDPWGLVVTEALATGLPVVASGMAGSSSTVVPGVNGAVICDPDDPGEVAGHVVRLWDQVFERAEVAATVAALGVDAQAVRVEHELSATRTSGRGS